jgi:hypothetical protein
MSGTLRSVAQLAVGVAAFALAPVGYGALAFAGANLAFSLLFPPKAQGGQAKPQNLDLNLSDPDGPIAAFWGTMGGVGGNYTCVAKDSKGNAAGVLTTKKTSSSGGKGGGGQSTTEYHYYLVAEMAIGVAGDGGALYVDKLEMEDGDGNTVLFDRFATTTEARGMTLTPEYSTAGTLISESGTSKKGKIEFHLGTEEQQACSFLEEYWGVGNVCPLRGLAKVGFNRLEITSQPTFKFTVRCVTTNRQQIIIKRLQDTGIPKSRMYIQQVRGDVLGAAANGVNPARTLCEQLAARVFCAFSFNNARLEDFSKENVKTYTIESTDLGARDIDSSGSNDQQDDTLAFQMKSDDDFYSSVEASFIDVDNLYTQNTGVASRHTAKNANPNTLQLPEAARIADIVPWCAASLDEDSAADRTVKFALLPGFCEMTTGNVVSVPVRRNDGSEPLEDYLITELNVLPSGVLQYTGTPYVPEVYDQPAYNTAGDAGDVATVPTAPISFISTPPALDSSQLDAAGILVAATVDSGEWGNNGTIFDFGGTGLILTTLQHPATMGYITEDFAIGNMYDYDTTKTLNITMYGDGVLQTADEADVRAGANVLLFEDGRVISFITATQTGAQQYQISGIKDGRAGSDYSSEFPVYGVAGSGDVSYIMDYPQQGYYNSKPYFVSANNKYLFYNSGHSQWWINDVLGGSSASYYNNSTASTPPLTSWIVGNKTGPAPMITLKLPGALSGAKVLLLRNHDTITEGSVEWVQTAAKYYNQRISSQFYPVGHQGDSNLLTTVSSVCSASNLKSPAPVNVKLVRGGDNSATITGRLRTRINDDGAWNTASPGTMTDEYNGVFGVSVKLTDGSKVARWNFTTATVGFSVTISAAQIIAAFGSSTVTLSGDVFMTNHTIGDGRPRGVTES